MPLPQSAMAPAANCCLMKGMCMYCGSHTPAMLSFLPMSMTRLQCTLVAMTALFTGVLTIAPSGMLAGIALSAGTSR